MPLPRLPIALPSPHFMAFAPLDVWARLLLAARGRIPARYWVRLAANLFTSCIGTVATLPERVVLWLWWHRSPERCRQWRENTARESGATRNGATQVVVILGYFRSGTTHLHYLMSCDPAFRTPRWCETLAPQGFVLSWAFLRLFLIPFVSAKRPQDDVAIGPEWPAEDDFAVNNAALASSLPGRFVLPRMHAHFDRFHALEGLSEAELSRWRRAQRAFCWKMARVAGRRAILLKTPSHTARVRELMALLGPQRVKFVHISREPAAVVRSNVAMAARLSIYNLQDPDPADDLEARITREYVRTERKYLEEAAAVAPGHLSQVRYEDLIADPMGELRRVYGELGLAWTPEFQARALAYLDSVRDYKPATRPSAKAGPAAPELAELARAFGHDRPARPRVEPPALAAPVNRTRTAIAAAAAAALLSGLVWIGQAWFLHDRHDWLAWPVGLLIGLIAVRVRGSGSVGLGLWASALTVLVFAAVSIPATFLSDYAHRTSPPFAVGYDPLPPLRDWEWYHILKASRVGSLAINNLFWLFMGVVTAYRFASRQHLRPPGT